MSQVDFYVLRETTSEARWLFACRLCEKALRANMNTLVLVDTPEQAQALDEQLWTFKPESFVPHQLLDANAPGAQAQAYIAHAQQTLSEAQLERLSGQGLLINLSSQVPAIANRFARLGELVIQAPEALATSRERFSIYKSQGHSLATHKL